MNEVLPLNNSVKGTVGPGGYCEVLAVPQEDIYFFPVLNPETETVTDSILLKQTKFFLAFTLSFNGRSFSEEMQVGKPGIFFQQTVSGKNFDQSKTNHILFQNMHLHRWVLIVRERKTGITYVIGRPDAACAFAVNYKSQDGTITDISWSNQSMYKSLLYSGSVFAVPPGVITEKPFLIMLVEFRIGAPGKPAPGQTTFTFSELVGKEKLAVYIDGSLISSEGYPDVLAYTYTPGLGKIDTTFPLQDKSVVQIYEVKI